MAIKSTAHNVVKSVFIAFVLPRPVAGGFYINRRYIGVRRQLQKRICPYMIFYQNMPRWCIDA